MKRLVKPSVISGKTTAPASKSIAQRAIAIASISSGKSVIHFPGSSDDVKSAISVCKELGASITEKSDFIEIDGGISTPNQPLNCGESGLAIRMFSPIVASLNQPVILTGHGTLVNRPMGIVEQSVTAMGAICETNNGLIPIKIKGPIRGGRIHVDGSISSQVLTGMLIATPLAQNDTEIEVSNLLSKPYIDLTIEVMQAFGVEVENNNYKTFFVKAGQTYKPTQFVVEGDWSGASFILVAGAIAGSVRVENLNPFSKQADIAILNAIKQTGAKITLHKNSIEVVKNELKPFQFDATHCPDLFPPLVALAANCNGESQIAGVSRLRAKESDRAATLCEEFSKMGIKITVKGELMLVEGGKIRTGKVHSHGDHRIAMATAIAALTAEKDVEINATEAVGKSYPEFFDDLRSICIDLKQ